VVGFGNLAAVKGAGNERFARGAIGFRPEVVDKHFAVDFGRVEEGAALPEQVVLFADAFDEEVEFLADPLACFWALIFCWSRIRRLRRDSMMRLGTLSSRAKAGEPSSPE